MRYELQLQMWGRVKNVSKENCFSSFVKTCLFLLLTDEKRKKWLLMKREKKMIEVMLLTNCSSSFILQIFGKKLYFKLTSSMSYGFNFSNFCIVFFIFQRVQSLRDSKEIDGLHVDGYLSNVKLELVIDNPSLLRWDIKYVFPLSRPQY